MIDDPRVDRLLEGLLESGGTPEEACRDCPELLPDVRAGLLRLRVLDQEIDALFPPSDLPGVDTPAAPPTAELPRIAGYEVEEVLGRGGVGVVYRARHLRLNRPVALKMLLAGPYARPQERERFLREAEAVAGLRHPNVVQLYDVGDVDGRPYFTMELVEGGSLARALAGAPRPARPAAALVAAVADAIEVAHQSGIVHRDLKPANVLLTADGTPKVADFGLARRLEGGGGLSLSGVAVGTPSYMAPEQARGDKDAIGPATDVYALGVILYEVLTGRPPFRSETPAATLHQVMVDEPVPLARLNPHAPRDLETICLKCLAKEPSRRYASAAALAEDLRRFGRGEPIKARPIGAAGRLVRWARRHPAVAGLSGALLFVTLLLIAGLVTGMVITTDALRRARRARTDEAVQRAEAEKQLGRSRRVNDILASIFRDVNPQLAERGGPPLLAQLGERLDRAAVLFEGEPIGDPVPIARMQVYLGHAQLNLGYPRRAIELFTKARRTLEALRGPDDVDVLMCISLLSQAYLADGQIARAVSLGKEALARRRAALGPDHPATLRSMNNLATAHLAEAQPVRAIPLCEAALGKQRAVLGPDHSDTLATLTNLATAYENDGRLDLSVSIFEELLARRRAVHSPDHPDTLAASTGLAGAYVRIGEPARAVPLLEQALAKHQARIGADHPVTLKTMVNLGLAYQSAGQPDRAVPLFEQVSARFEARSGPDHPDTLSTLHQLADGYRSVGKVHEALALYEKVVAKRQSILGPDHPETLSVRFYLAQTYQMDGQLAKALRMYEQVLEKQRARPGPDHPDTLLTLCALGTAYYFDRQVARAVATLEQVREKQAAIVGPDSPDTLATTVNLAAAYRSSGQTARAIPLLERAVATRKVRLGPSHPDTLLAMSNLAMDYDECGRYAEAELLLVHWLAEQPSRLPADAVEVALRKKRLGRCRLLQQKYADAEQPLRDALAIFEKRRPKSAEQNETESLLGAALAGQQKYADAEPLLGDSARALKALAVDSSAARRQAALTAVQRVIDLYETWGRPEDAARWRAELEGLKPPG
jgi:tetratricopeptide (TPR) repeat protein